MSGSVLPGGRPDRPEEECAVFGVFAPGEDVARMACFGLQALQHRGQESAGIAVGDGETVMAAKDLGLVLSLIHICPSVGRLSHVENAKVFVVSEAAGMSEAWTTDRSRCV